MLEAAQPDARASGADVGALLALVELLRGTTPAERAALAAACSRRSVARGQVLLLEGERSDAVYVVERGRLKVLLSSAGGGELVLSVLGPGDAFGEISVLDGRTRSATVQATVDTDVLVLPGAALRALLQSSPQLALGWATLLAGQVRRLTVAQADLVFLDLPRRLAKLVVEAGGTSVDLGSSQTELAARLGVARQSLNRALAALSSRGWLSVHGARVRLEDPDALRRFADAG